MTSAPLKALLVELNKAIKTLGYNTKHSEFPRIFIDQMNMRDTKITKDSIAWEFSFLIDVVTKSTSQLSSLEIIENVRSAINEDTINIEGYSVQSVEPESLTSMSEIEDTIWRQLQRYRVLITKQI